jgi:hypothetical protein
MDQRRTESLNRFLMCRALRKVKNPDQPKKSIPFLHPVRWKFSISNRSLIIRLGLIGLSLYWHAIAPVPYNVGLSAETTGVIFFIMPLGMVEGELCPCKRWVKQENILEEV